MPTATARYPAPRYAPSKRRQILGSPKCDWQLARSRPPIPPMPPIPPTPPPTPTAWCPAARFALLLMLTSTPTTTPNTTFIPPKLHYSSLSSHLDTAPTHNLDTPLTDTAPTHDPDTDTTHT